MSYDKLCFCPELLEFMAKTRLLTWKRKQSNPASLTYEGRKDDNAAGKVCAAGEF
jgi:hypothetical protein